ncbi:hypothetical protein L0Z72_12450 [candidate division KSB1 bacterium]|nr:hypothetical protein [candidate division KSB1 bacterium]
MKYIFSALFIILIFANLVAGDDGYIISQTGFLKIMPLYQSWKIGDNFSVSEVSIPLFLYYPLNRQMSLSLQGSQASVSGDMPGLNGITDVQLAFNYQWQENLVFNVGFNVPSGKKELSMSEFQTSALLSLNHFTFQVPNFGQGFNASPGLTWALPLGEKAVFGLGASYQYKGKFKPLKGMSDDYDPGDEILVTGGVDLLMSEKTTFAVDVVYIFFGEDKIDNQKVYRSGNKILINARFRTWIDYNELVVLAHYRSKSKNSYVIGGVFQEELDNTTPDQIEVMGQYRMRWNPKFYATVLAEARSFQPTSFADGVTIIGGGLAPEILLLPNLAVLAKIKYLFGNYANDLHLSGLELGIGFSLKF